MLATNNMNTDIQKTLDRAVELKQAIDKINEEQIAPLDDELKTIQAELVAFMSHEDLKHIDTQGGHKIDLVTRTSSILDKDRLNKYLEGKLDEYYSQKSSSFIKITTKK